MSAAAAWLWHDKKATLPAGIGQQRASISAGFTVFLEVNPLWKEGMMEEVSSKPKPMPAGTDPAVAAAAAAQRAADVQRRLGKSAERTPFWHVCDDLNDPGASIWIMAKENLGSPVGVMASLKGGVKAVKGAAKGSPKAAAATPKPAAATPKQDASSTGPTAAVVSPKGTVASPTSPNSRLFANIIAAKRSVVQMVRLADDAKQAKHFIRVLAIKPPEVLPGAPAPAPVQILSQDESAKYVEENKDWIWFRTERVLGSLANMLGDYVGFNMPPAEPVAPSGAAGGKAPATPKAGSSTPKASAVPKTPSSPAVKSPAAASPKSTPTRSGWFSFRKTPQPAPGLDINGQPLVTYHPLVTDELLQEHERLRKPLEDDSMEVDWLMFSLCQALAELHTSRPAVTHYDISPRSVVVTQPSVEAPSSAVGDFEVAAAKAGSRSVSYKLVGFGLAQYSGYDSEVRFEFPEKEKPIKLDKKGSARDEQPPAVRPRLAFTAPEIASLKKASINTGTGPVSDIFSLGCVAAEVLAYFGGDHAPQKTKIPAHRLVQSGESLAEYTKQVSDPAFPANELSHIPNLPEHWATVLPLMLRSDPAKRPTSKQLLDPTTVAGQCFMSPIFRTLVYMETQHRASDSATRAKFYSKIAETYRDEDTDGADLFTDGVFLFRVLPHVLKDLNIATSAEVDNDHSPELLQRLLEFLLSIVMSRPSLPLTESRATATRLLDQFLQKTAPELLLSGSPTATKFVQSSLMLLSTFCKDSLMASALKNYPDFCVRCLKVNRTDVVQGSLVALQAILSKKPDAVSPAEMKELTARVSKLLGSTKLAASVLTVALSTVSHLPPRLFVAEPALFSETLVPTLLGIVRRSSTSSEEAVSIESGTESVNILYKFSDAFIVQAETRSVTDAMELVVNCSLIEMTRLMPTLAAAAHARQAILACVGHAIETLTGRYVKASMAIANPDKSAPAPVPTPAANLGAAAVFDNNDSSSSDSEQDATPVKKPSFMEPVAEAEAASKPVPEPEPERSPTPPQPLALDVSPLQSDTDDDSDEESYKPAPLVLDVSPLQSDTDDSDDDGLS